MEAEEIEFIRELSFEDQVEMSAVNVQDHYLVIVCIYRPPKGNVDCYVAQVDAALNRISNTFWWLETSMQISLKIPKKKVTKTSSTCVDNIFTNLIPESYQASTNNSHIAGHRAQFMKIEKLIKPTDNITDKYVRMINDPNTHLFKEKLRMSDWLQITQYEDAEQCFMNSMKFFILILKAGSL
ncbi:hypothetical protein HHI36_005067 [Cryptolaemus montrouzieri]|uniref:Uncharacterized protein n=1 Tax=Cryptolaemus montrouzieri TaxID=559131 RepID=A0ABD2NTY2_9CUCU